MLSRAGRRRKSIRRTLVDAWMQNGEGVTGGQQAQDTTLMVVFIRFLPVFVGYRGAPTSDGSRSDEMTGQPESVCANWEFRIAGNVYQQMA